MKVEQLMVQYLYKYKTVSLQDMGSFTIANEIDIPQDSDKETILPDGAIIFEYNPKTGADEGLVDFIVQHSRKIRPLAASDLESYSILSRQFLNIGKPLIIEGLGMLQKNQKGFYEFIQGHTVASKMDAAPAAMKEKLQDEISFSTKAKEPANRKGWMLLLGLIFLIGIGIAIYYFLNNENNDERVTQSGDTVLQGDTLKANVGTLMTAKDSSVLKDSMARLVKPANDGYSFKVVLKEYPAKMLADKAFEKLTNYGHKLLVTQKDSFTYIISMPFTSPLSDTLRAKDSLKRFFGGNPYIVL